MIQLDGLRGHRKTIQNECSSARQDNHAQATGKTTRQTSVGLKNIYGQRVTHNASRLALLVHCLLRGPGVDLGVTPVVGIYG
jgi:hypothetical protein